MNARSARSSTSPASVVSRRQFVATAAAAGVWAAGGLLRAEDAAAPKSQRSIRVAHFTDLHLSQARNSAAGVAQALKHVQSLDDPPQLLLTGGDLINDALHADRSDTETQWKLLLGVLKAENSLPVEHTLGNHDIWGWDRQGSKTTGDEMGWGKQLAAEKLGLELPYHVATHSGWNFVHLDSCTFDEDNLYRGELDEEQFDWLSKTLSEIAPRPTVVISHIPIVAVAALEWSESLEEKPSRRHGISHKDAKQLVSLFRRHPHVKVCLSGHTHLTERIDYAGVSYINSGAICGRWWQGDHLHTDEGYSLLDLYDDGRFEQRYVPYNWQVANG